MTGSGLTGRSRIVALVLLAVGVLGLATGGVTALVARGDDGDRRSSAAAQDAVTVASDFAVAYNTYDAADLDDYQSRVEPLLAADYRDEFAKVTDALFPTLASKQQVSTGAAVLSAAVDDLDDDSATVLVAVDSAITNTDNTAAIARHFRWVVSLTRSGDDWRVSQFQPVASSDAIAQTEGADGAPTPTPEVTP